jgi:hypothetical protein
MACLFRTGAALSRQNYEASFTKNKKAYLMIRRLGRHCTIRRAERIQGEDEYLYTAPPLRVVVVVVVVVVVGVVSIQFTTLPSYNKHDFVTKSRRLA